MVAKQRRVAASSDDTPTQQQLLTHQEQRRKVDSRQQQQQPLHAQKSADRLEHELEVLQDRLATAHREGNAPRIVYLQEEINARQAALAAVRKDNVWVAFTAFALLLLIAVVWTAAGLPNPLQYLEQITKSVRQDMQHKYQK